VPESSSFHEEFGAVLKGDDDVLTPWLADPTHIARLRVYRNNVTTAWADTIVKNYPAVERLVGTNFMRGAAIAYVRAHPPKTPVLSLYGDSFAAFLKSFEPAKQLPYLPDVARLERAWTEAFFAPNVTPLEPGHIANLNEAQISALAPGLHPSVRMITSNWNAWEIWQANRNEAAAEKIELKSGASAAIVWWSPDGVVSRALLGAEHEFLEAISSGTTLGGALGGVDAAHQPEITTFFSEALSRGVFAQPNLN